MAIQVYFSSHIDCLGDYLADILVEEQKSRRDPFWSPKILVPNPAIQKWIELRIACRHSIAMNMSFDFLERGLFQLLSSCGHHTSRQKEVFLLSRGMLRWLILRVLFSEINDIAALSLFSDYLGKTSDILQVDYSQRLWQLSDKLSRLFLEYEHHRQEMILSWITSGKDKYQGAMYEAQKGLYRRLFAKGELRDTSFPHYFTLPQLTYSLQTQYPVSLLSSSEEEKNTPIHVFSFSPLSPFHTRILYDLGKDHTIFLYIFNVCEEYWEDIQDNAFDVTSEYDNSLLRQWGKAGGEVVRQLSELESRSVGQWRYQDKWLYAKNQESLTILGALQKRIRQRTNQGERRSQDRSLQIISSPTIIREIETVANSIIFNMLTNEDLLLTDIAVLVPDMRKYRSTIESVFQKVTYPVQYRDHQGNIAEKEEPIFFNLSDASAKSKDSHYANALISLLSLSTFSRREVIDLMLNPCFLAGNGIDRSQVMIWSRWIEELGIFQHTTKEHKKKDGGIESSLYTWEHGLRRLRLGRIMTTEQPLVSPDTRMWCDLIPFVPPEYHGEEMLNKFCLILEVLFARLSSLRGMIQTGEKWVLLIQKLQNDFLAIPKEHPEEAFVQQFLLQSMREELTLFDHMVTEKNKDGISLPIILSFIKSKVEEISAYRGHYLSGGVNISSIRPMRPVPFRLVYIVGLGEKQFPGTSDTSTLDLRCLVSPSGSRDITTPELNRYLFLETLMTVKEKIYLSYVNRDAKRDSALHPCSIIHELIHYVEKYILLSASEQKKTSLAPAVSNSKSAEYSAACGSFFVADVPFNLDERYIQENPFWTDVFHSYSNMEHLLFLTNTTRDIPEKINQRYQDIYLRCWRKTEEHAPIQPDNHKKDIHLFELKWFLENPVTATLQHHLGFRSPFKTSNWDQEEPFYSTSRQKYRFLLPILEHLFHCHRNPSGEFREIEKNTIESETKILYKILQSKGMLPEENFGTVDYRGYQEIVQKTFFFNSPLKNFLENMVGTRIFRHIVIGENRHNKVSEQHLPEFSLDISSHQDNPHKVSLHGSIPWLWKNQQKGTWETLIITTSRTSTAPTKYMIETFLFMLLFQIINDYVTPFTIHVLSGDNLKSWHYHPEIINWQYFADLLDGFAFTPTYDCLPFDFCIEGYKNIMKEKKEMSQQAFDQSFYSSLAANFCQTLYQRITEEMTMGRHPIAFDHLLSLFPIQVPEDALHKVKRRLGPLFSQSHQWD